MKRRLAMLGIALAIAVSTWFAINAFRRTRNNAIEKSMLGEARMISSAANQIFTETKKKQIRFAELKRYCHRPNAGMKIAANENAFGESYYENIPGTLTQDGVFFISHNEWHRNLSCHSMILSAGGSEHAVKFSVDSGAPIP